MNAVDFDKAFETVDRAFDMMEEPSPNIEKATRLLKKVAAIKAHHDKVMKSYAEKSLVDRVFHEANEIVVKASLLLDDKKPVLLQVAAAKMKLGLCRMLPKKVRKAA